MKNAVRSRKIIMLSLMAGKTNGQILDELDTELPGNSSSLGSIAWYRMRARQAGLRVPPSRELRGIEKPENSVTVTDDRERGIEHYRIDKGGPIRTKAVPKSRSIVLEGEQLTHAIKRAKRWWKGSPRVGHHRAPSHITLFSFAWRKSDPEGFMKFMKEELTF